MTKLALYSSSVSVLSRQNSRYAPRYCLTTLHHHAALAHAPEHEREHTEDGSPEDLESQRREDAGSAHLADVDRKRRIVDGCERRCEGDVLDDARGEKVQRHQRSGQQRADELHH